MGGGQLEITETDKYTYIMTYSFPCQDLSSAGLCKGMEKGSGTRSGLLWEVERLLDECEEKPQILLMENVPEVIGANNIKDFSKWLAKLESLGYKCYWKCLNGKEYGIPQNRNRCFMVSVLGDYYYEFPKPIKLEKRLKDILEKDIKKEYYLSEDIIDCFIKHTQESKEKGNGFKFSPTSGDCVGKAITTRAGSRMDDNFIKCEIVGMLSNEKYKKMHDIARRVYSTDRIAPTQHCCGGGNLETKILIEKDIKKSTKEIFEEEERIISAVKNGKELYKSRQGFSAENSIGINVSTTIKAENANNYCILSVDDLEYPCAYDEQNRYSRTDGCVGTLTTDGSSPKHNNRIIENSHLIRKLTEKECFRLMGVKDNDFDRIALNQSKSSLYHLAGDSIVTTVLMAIFGNMLDIDYREHLWL